MAGPAILKIDILADASKAKAAFADVGGAGSRIGSTLGTVARVGSVAFAAVGAAAIGMAGAGLKVAASNEQAAVSFTTLLGSSEKAGAYMKELQAFAAQTPFEFPELRDAASRFLAVGVESGRVIPIMKTLGDATSAMGTGTEGINRATTALTQMQQKGKVTAEEMLQLTEAGIPAWDALAAVLGTDVAGAQKMVTEGQVEANKMFEALETSAGPALGRVAGMMETQAQTLSGLFSTLKDTISQQLGEAMGPAVEVLKGQLPAITAVISSALTTLGPVFGSLIGSLASALSALLPAITPVISVVGSVFAAALEALVPVITMLVPYLQEFATTVGNALFDAIKAIAPLLPDIVQLIARFAVIAAQVGAELLAALIPALVKIVEAVLPIIPVIMDLAGMLVAALMPAIKPLIPLIVTLAEDLAGELGETVKELAPVVLTLGKVLAALLVALMPLISAVLRLIVAISPLLPVILPLIAAIWLLNAAMGANPILLVVIALAALVAGIMWAYQNVEWFRDLVQGAWAVVVAAFNFLKEGVELVFNWIKSNWPLLLAILTGPIGIAIGLIVGHWDTVKAAAQTLLSFIGSIFSAIGRVISSAASFIGGIASGIAATFRTISDAATAVYDWVKSKFDALVQVIRDILSGVRTAIGNVADAIKSPINAVLRGWNNLTFRVPEVDLGPFGKIGGQSWSPPDIPTLASGGSVLRTGLAIVHHGETFSGVGKSLGGGNTNITVHVTTTGLGADAPEIQRAVANALRGYTTRNGPLDIPVRQTA